MEITLKILSGLFRQHVGLLIEDYVWIDKEVELKQIGLFYIYQNEKFYGCTKAHCEPLIIDMKEMDRLYPSNARVGNEENLVNRSMLMDSMSPNLSRQQNTEESSHSVKRSTPIVPSSSNAEDAFVNYDKDKVLSPINPACPQVLREIQGNIDLQPVFPPRGISTVIEDPADDEQITANSLGTGENANNTSIADNPPIGYTIVKFRCKRCDEIFNTDQGYFNHIFKVHKCRSKKRNPPVLEKTFIAIPGRTKGHVEEVYQPDDDLDCGICDRSLFSHKLLRRHVKNEHPDFKPFLCPYCDFLLFFEENYMQHMQSHIDMELDLEKKETEKRNNDEQNIEPTSTDFAQSNQEHETDVNNGNKSGATYQKENEATDNKNIDVNKAKDSDPTQDNQTEDAEVKDKSVDKLTEVDNAAEIAEEVVSLIRTTVESNPQSNTNRIQVTEGIYQCDQCDVKMHTETGLQCHMRSHAQPFKPFFPDSYNEEDAERARKSNRERAVAEALAQNAIVTKIQKDAKLVHDYDTSVDSSKSGSPPLTNKLLGDYWKKASESEPNPKRKSQLKLRSQRFYDEYDKEKANSSAESLKPNETSQNPETTNSAPKSNSNKKKVSFSKDVDITKQITDTLVPIDGKVKDTKKAKKSSDIGKEDENSSDSDSNVDKASSKRQSRSNKRGRKQQTDDDSPIDGKRSKRDACDDQKVASGSKRFSTKDPRCKTDTDLLKEKKYDLRRSLTVRKKYDGDDSKDKDWVPLDTTNSSEENANKSTNVKPGKNERKRQSKPTKNQSPKDNKRLKKEDATKKVDSKSDDEDSMKYPCQKCGTEFTDHDEFELHRRSCFKKKRKYICPVESCMKPFAEKSMLDDHFDYHHTDKPYKYVCNKCNKVFVYKRVLVLHKERKHTSPDKKPHMCDKCGKLFSKRWEYANHIERTHSKVKPFKCGRCNDAAFTTANGLSAHIRHCGADPQYDCNICGKQFVLQHNYTRHVSEIHRKNIKYKCPKCDKLYGTEGGFYNHTRTKHGLGKNHQFSVRDLNVRVAIKKEEESDNQSDDSDDEKDKSKKDGKDGESDKE